ncbi:hypothetical protein Tco_0994939 [Tanacetum coccineum]
MLNGSQENSFEHLPLYCHNLKLTNDGTVTHIQTKDDGTFDKCFIGFGVSIRSFLYYMRPLIKIDGAHLKGTYLGTNLLVVGMDANNQIIPLATGVAQDEPLVDELSRWAAAKVSKRNRKGTNWIVHGIEHLKMYNVKDHKAVQVVDIVTPPNEVATEYGSESVTS